MSVQSRQKTAQSQIPVITPRPPQSSLPSSLTSPHLGLVPPGRHLAVSGSPTHPSASNTTPSSSSNSTPFRSFRNFLSFGPHKSQSGPTASSVAGLSRPSLGGLRRSTNGERSLSSPNLPATNVDTTPVLTVELSHKVNEPLIDSEELQSRLLQPPTPENFSPLSSVSTLSSRVVAITPDQPVYNDRSPKLTELSTILEAESSGISRHIPDFDDSKDTTSTRTGASPNTIPSRIHEQGAHDVSFLDLSTSGLHKEVLAALSQSGPREGWEDGIVVEDAVDSPPTSPPGGVHPDISFHLGAVDPDLAVLLSSNHAQASEPALLVADAVSSPLRSPTQTVTEPNSPASPSRPISDSRTPPHSAGRSTSVPRPSPSSRPPLDRSTSLSASKLPVQSSSTRLARSATERPSFSGSERTYLPSPAKTEEPDGRPSLQLPRKRPSPLLQESPLPRPTSSHGTEYDTRRTSASRLATPARHITPLNSTRNGLRLIPSPQSSPGYEGSESVSSRSPSAITPSTSRRLNSVRPSLDSSADRPRAYTRDRSASLTEGLASPYDVPSKRPVDWLGPRTAKAFAAAGLLDSEREREAPGPSVGRPGSRFGYGSTRSERDFRSQYAPSRAGFSDISSPSTWGRRSGSISRRGSDAIASVLGTPMSDSASTPRTTFSGASTAPTSVSSSSVQRHLQEELNTLQEKHALETSALLSALADSQRTTRMLREENAQLRDRLQYAEAQLSAAHEELHRAQFAQSFNPPSTSTFGRGSLHRLAGQDPARRGYPSSRLQTILHSSADDLRLEDLRVERPAAKQPPPDIPPQDPIPPRPSLDTLSRSSSRRRAYSGSSSVFRAPPSNMTLLLHEDGPAPAPPSSGGSPPLTHPVPAQHAAHKSVSSAGNISPTTATFSMMTGSPGSLCLRPEHEQLLGDMPTLDLGADEYGGESPHGL